MGKISRSGLKRKHRRLLSCQEHQRSPPGSRATGNKLKKNDPRERERERERPEHQKKGMARGRAAQAGGRRGPWRWPDSGTTECRVDSRQKRSRRGGAPLLRVSYRIHVPVYTPTHVDGIGAEHEGSVFRVDIYIAQTQRPRERSETMVATVLESGFEFSSVFVRNSKIVNVLVVDAVWFGGRRLALHHCSPRVSNSGCCYALLFMELNAWGEEISWSGAARSLEPSVSDAVPPQACVRAGSDLDDDDHH